MLYVSFCIDKVLAHDLKWLFFADENLEKQNIAKDFHMKFIWDSFI